MAKGDIQLNSIGVVFEGTIKDQDDAIIDISTATTKEIIFNAPGKRLVGVAGLTTDGTDGKQEYTTVSGDLNMKGNWEWQMHVIIGTTDYHSDKQSFTVYGNL